MRNTLLKTQNSTTADQRWCAESSCNQSQYYVCRQHDCDSVEPKLNSHGSVLFITSSGSMLLTFQITQNCQVCLWSMVSPSSHHTGLHLAGFFQLPQVPHPTSQSLSTAAITTVTTAFFSCYLDYGNSLLYYKSDILDRKLQLFNLTAQTANVFTGYDAHRPQNIRYCLSLTLVTVGHWRNSTVQCSCSHAAKWCCCCVFHTSTALWMFYHIANDSIYCRHLFIVITNGIHQMTSLLSYITGIVSEQLSTAVLGSGLFTMPKFPVWLNTTSDPNRTIYDRIRQLWPYKGCCHDLFSLHLSLPGAMLVKCGN